MMMGRREWYGVVCLIVFAFWVSAEVLNIWREDLTFGEKACVFVPIAFVSLLCVEAALLIDARKGGKWRGV